MSELSWQIDARRRFLPRRYAKSSARLREDQPLNGYVVNSRNTLLRDHLRYGIPHTIQHLTTISERARLKNTTGPGPAALWRREHLQLKKSGIPGAVPRWVIPQMTPT
jgi:hypothetical protein